MKTKIFLCSLLFLCCWTQSQAQKNLNSLREQMERDKNVEIISKSKTDLNETVTYRIKNDRAGKNLQEKLREAFDKDRDGANRIVNMENDNQANRYILFKNEGEDVSYRIISKKKETDIFYRSIKKKGRNYFFRGENWEHLMKEHNLDSIINNSQWNSITLNNELMKMKGNMQSFSISDLPNISAESLLRHWNGGKNTLRRFMIPEGGELYIDGKKLSPEEARKMGYDVRTFSPEKDKDKEKERHFRVPEGSYMIINGRKVTIEEAQEMGYHIEIF